jgi:hypothetical protein
MDDGIELSAVIWQLRHELSRAMWGGEDADIRFDVGPIQLELTVAVEKATQPAMKAKLLVLEAGADLRRAATTTQKINLTLTPRRANGTGPLEVKDQASPDER